ncbi:MAG: RNA polymerase sigma factor [Gemmatimonadales bacterium]|nr:RNA polymerase sigma factor [Gemmatimonadales bacterium]
MDPTVRAAQAGDEAAFARLYREHVGRIHAVCLRLTGDRAEAEQLTQDAFVRCWEQLPSFRGEAAFGTWLHRLAVNVVLGDRRSARRRELRVAIVEEPETLGAASRGAPAGLAMDLEGAIARLPPGARQVFVLHDIEGYAHGEIAELAGIAEGTSKAHLHRARKLLRAALER